jgi:hypothetical protein
MSDDPLKALLAPAQAKSPEPLTPFGSAAMEKRGPWMREHMPSTLADLLASYMAYAPLALPAYTGRGMMPNRLAPQDFAIAPAMERGAAQNYPNASAPDIMPPDFGSGALGRISPDAMRQFRSGGRQDPGSYVATPEEVGAWGMQKPANMSDAAYQASRHKPGLLRDLYDDAVQQQLHLNRRVRESERPFDIIPGGRKDP